MVQWPTGVGVRHSSGVAESVARVRGAIGYLDYGNAVRRNLAYALVQNRAGNIIAPGLASFQTAIMDVDWSKDRDFYITLTNAEPADAYPIMALSFAVIRSFPKTPGRARDMRAFFQWAMAKGQDLAALCTMCPCRRRWFNRSRAIGERRNFETRNDPGRPDALISCRSHWPNAHGRCLQAYSWLAAKSQISIAPVARSSV